MSLRNVAILLAPALAIAPLIHAADGRAISAALNKAHEGRTLALRAFYDGPTLHYSSPGSFIKGGRPVEVLTEIGVNFRLRQWPP